MRSIYLKKSGVNFSEEYEHLKLFIVVYVDESEMGDFAVVIAETEEIAREMAENFGQIFGVLELYPQLAKIQNAQSDFYYPEKYDLGPAQ